MITVPWVDITKKSIKNFASLFNFYELIRVRGSKKFLIKVNYVDLFKNENVLFLKLQYPD